MLSQDIKKMIRWSSYELHEHPMIKFFFVFLILLGYFIFTSVKFGADEGLLISLLTWSFFVLCTPIADAGILLDFPLRLFTGVRMIVSEFLVWGIAIALNVFTFFTARAVYSDTVLLSLFEHILEDPFPFWGIILLSGLGTFLSVLFGDELMDIAQEVKEKRSHHKKHHMKQKLVFLFFIILLVLALYDFLLVKLGVVIPLF